MDDGVKLEELAKKTKNFSGAEIEGLVRAAQSSAMNRLVRAGGRVEAEDDAVEKLRVIRDDFDYALEHDVKPVGDVFFEQINFFFSFFRLLVIAKKNLLFCLLVD